MGHVCTNNSYRDDITDVFLHSNMSIDLPLKMAAVTLAMLPRRKLNALPPLFCNAFAMKGVMSSILIIARKVFSCGYGCEHYHLKLFMC